MAIDFYGDLFPNIAGRSLTRLAQVAAAPQFEVSFAAAQAKALERFNAQIEEFQSAEFGRSKTVLLRAKVVRLEGALELAQTFKAHALTNRQTVKDVLTQLDELRLLADPATSAEFDAKKVELLDTIEKLRVGNVSGLGAPEGLRDLKTLATAAIGALSAVDAASAAAAQTEIDSQNLDFTDKLAIVELNYESATTLVKSSDRLLGELRLKIEDIEIDERKAQIDRIKEQEANLASVFSALSLSFESSRGFSRFVAENTVLKPELDPGSVLNLFA